MNRFTTALLSACALSLAALAAPVFAQSTAVPIAAAKTELVDAEVRKVDKDAGKVTLKHSEIKHLDMPAMTMVFRVQDPLLWATLTDGAKVKVAIEKLPSVGYTVMRAEPAK